MNLLLVIVFVVKRGLTCEDHFSDNLMTDGLSVNYWWNSFSENVDVEYCNDMDDDESECNLDPNCSFIKDYKYNADGSKTLTTSGCREKNKAQLFLRTDVIDWMEDNMNVDSPFQTWDYTQHGPLIFTQYTNLYDSTYKTDEPLGPSPGIYVILPGDSGYPDGFFGGQTCDKDLSTVIWAVCRCELSRVKNINEITTRQTNASYSDWIPDTDVRTISSSNTETKPGLFYYWDKELHPEQYEFTSAPAEVQFYFYPRAENSVNPEYDNFKIRNILGNNEDNNNDNFGDNFYITNLDWGDGSIEYTDESKNINISTIIKHNYTKPGIYEVTGYMYYGTETEVFPFKTSNNINKSIKRFVVKINLNETDKFNDFTFLGANNYTFIPYKETTPIIGGISSNSIYQNILQRQLGFYNSAEPIFNTIFQNYYDKLSAENALALIDENKILPTLNIFTKSYFDNSVYNALPGTDNYGSSFELGGTPTEIFKPKFNHFGELGNHLNYTDIAQIRYFNETKSMWELLGFADNNSGNPNDEKYWKNIVPQNFDVLTDYMDNEQHLFDIIASYSKILGGFDATVLQTLLVTREVCDEQTSVPLDGCSTEIQAIADEVSALDLYEYEALASDVTGINIMINIYIQQQTYYYPVLPNVNQYGRFDESLGLRNNNIPFGSERNWNVDDIEAPITNENYKDDSLLIDIKIDLLEQDVLEDNSGNKNIGMMISDYRIEFDNQTIEPKKGQTTKSIKIEKTNRKAF